MEQDCNLFWNSGVTKTNLQSQYAELKKTTLYFTNRAQIETLVGIKKCYISDENDNKERYRSNKAL